MPETNRSRTVVEAAERFAAAMRDPATGSLSEFRRKQQDAYEALLAAVDRDVVAKEAVDACDS
jgi:hypothetical protein